MKKILVFFLSAIILISPFNTPLYAYDALDKLQRGLVNLLVSPLEFFQTIGNVWSEQDIAVALPVGISYGAWNTAKRAGVGLFEILTFPFPIPEDYKPIIEEPAFLGRKTQKTEQEAEQETEEGTEQETEQELIILE